MQLAQLSDTSVANISQQLRLLEMAGLVQSKRISNRDKGKPRLLYSLVGNHSFLIASATDFVEKKLLKLSDYNKVILKIWFLDNHEAHYFLEKAFWNLEERINLIDAIYVDTTTLANPDIVVYVVSCDVSLKKELKKITVKNSLGISRNIIIHVKQKTDLSNLSKNLYAIYDPSNVRKKIGDDV